MMKANLFLLITVMALQTAGAREFRDFTNLSGKKIHGELLDLEDGKVRVRAKGKVFFIPVEKLSEADQTWLNEWDLKRKGEEDQLYYKEEIFKDDFSSDGFGERWKHYKSESVVTEGVLIGKTIDINDHAGVDAIKLEEGRRDLQFSVKFKFASADAKRFNVWFDDHQYKGSHAGHIASFTVTPESLRIDDAKTGGFNNEIYEERKSEGGLSEATKELLKTKTVSYPLELKREEWHELLIRTKGDKAVVKIDGKEIGELQSTGIAHMTKSSVSVTTNINDVHYDDFEIKAASNEGLEEVSQNEEEKEETK